jgi:thioesterase domain-containing protein
MAAQLRAQGETVSALIMIDPVDPAITRAVLIQEPVPFRLRFHFTRVLFHLQKIRHYSTKEKLAYFRKSLQAIGRRLKHKRETRQHADSQMAQSVVDVHASDMYGFTNAVPQPYPGQAILLRPGIRARGAYKYPNLRWGQLITGGLELQAIPGDSDSMWLAPNAKGMAQVIESCLDRVAGISLPKQPQKVESGDIERTQNA